MQNKPNLRKAKMKLNFCSTKDYENQGRLRTPAKQTQSNPISRAKKKAAARTYDAKAAELFGEYAALNFRGA